MTKNTASVLAWIFFIFIIESLVTLKRFHFSFLRTKMYLFLTPFPFYKAFYNASTFQDICQSKFTSYLAADFAIQFLPDIFFPFNHSVICYFERNIFLFDYQLSFLPRGFVRYCCQTNFTTFLGVDFAIQF
jgi:hypothetical protein